MISVQGEVIHGFPLPVDCYRVQLTTVLERGSKYKVLIPADEEEEEVERNHGYFLLWPRHLVLLSGQVINFFTKLVNFKHALLICVCVCVCICIYMSKDTMSLISRRPSVSLTQKVYQIIFKF
jgi:hypothetical protein